MARRVNKFWIALKTKQASSSDAVTNVRRQGFEYFHPQFRRRAVRGVRAITPLFPYYLIVRVDQRKQDWKVLSSTKGVAQIVGRIARDEQVDHLREIIESTVDGYYHDPLCDHPSFAPGESVEGLRGLFKDKFGTYVGLAGNSAARVRVLFNILGRDSEFEVRADDLQAVAA